MSRRGLLPGACAATLAVSALALLLPHPAPTVQPHPPYAAPSIADVPRVDPAVLAVNRRTRAALDACQARAPAGRGVLVVIAPGRDGRPTIHLRGNAPGVCAYRVDN